MTARTLDPCVSCDRSDLPMTTQGDLCYPLCVRCLAIAQTESAQDADSAAGTLADVDLARGWGARPADDSATDDESDAMADAYERWLEGGGR